MTKGAINAPDFVGVSRSCYAVFRHLDLGDSTKREEQLDQIFRRIFGSLAQDVADRGGYGCMEQYISGLQPGELVVSNPSDSVQEGATVEIRTR